MLNYRILVKIDTKTIRESNIVYFHVVLLLTLSVSLPLIFFTDTFPTTLLLCYTYYIEFQLWLARNAHRQPSIALYSILYPRPREEITADSKMHRHYILYFRSHSIPHLVDYKSYLLQGKTLGIFALDDGPSSHQDHVFQAHEGTQCSKKSFMPQKHCFSLTFRSNNGKKMLFFKLKAFGKEWNNRTKLKSGMEHHNVPRDWS